MIRPSPPPPLLASPPSPQRPATFRTGRRDASPVSTQPTPSNGYCCPYFHALRPLWPPRCPWHRRGQETTLAAPCAAAMRTHAVLLLPLAGLLLAGLPTLMAQVRDGIAAAAPAQAWQLNRQLGAGGEVRAGWGIPYLDLPALHLISHPHTHPPPAHGIPTGCTCARGGRPRRWGRVDLWDNPDHRLGRGSIHRLLHARYPAVCSLPVLQVRLLYSCILPSCPLRQCDEDRQAFSHHSPIPAPCRERRARARKAAAKAAACTRELLSVQADHVSIPVERPASPVGSSREHAPQLARAGSLHSLTRRLHLPGAQGSGCIIQGLALRDTGSTSQMHSSVGQVSSARPSAGGWELIPLQASP